VTSVGRAVSRSALSRSGPVRARYSFTPGFLRAAHARQVSCPSFLLVEYISVGSQVARILEVSSAGLSLLLLAGVMGSLKSGRCGTPRVSPFDLGWAVGWGCGGFHKTKAEQALQRSMTRLLLFDAIVAPTSAWSSIAVVSRHPVRDHGSACLTARVMRGAWRA
jgi:hypothetical protein